MSDTNKTNWKEKELGALWDRGGKWSGKITINGETINLICFPNSSKANPSAPDIRIYRSDSSSAPASTAAPKSVVKPKTQQTASPVVAAAQPEIDEATL